MRLTEDQEWEVKQDIDALNRVNEINANPARKKRAIQYAQQKADEATASAKALSMEKQINNSNVKRII